MDRAGSGGRRLRCPGTGGLLGRTGEEGRRSRKADGKSASEAGVGVRPDGGGWAVRLTVRRFPPPAPRRRRHGPGGRWRTGPEHGRHGLSRKGTRGIPGKSSGEAPGGPPRRPAGRRARFTRWAEAGMMKPCPTRPRYAMPPCSGAAQNG
ncbi:hypothetical protein GCM10009564_24270 [Streptomyces thermogriseus]|uniref:Uncharacterized protein n=1 Tax=Streptomyces thermogriseus TaxID=75292 RepID=A0ABN1SYC0_9ACTN